MRLKKFANILRAAKKYTRGYRPRVYKALQL